MSLLTSGQNPRSTDNNNEVEQAILYAKGDRKLAAAQFLQRTLWECKNDDQKNAIEAVTEVIEAYYYGKYNSMVSQDSLKRTPILTMIGVPGAGKSWVVGRIRTWIDIRMEGHDLPYQSSEYITLNHESQCDPVTNKTRNIINNPGDGKYGKSAAVAFSGCAAGILKGFTVHNAFSFPVNLCRQIINGELPLQELNNSVRTKLLDCWSSVKMIIIDEVYMLKVEWLSLIDERLRQIFNTDIPFAGIPILIAGDPRQIILVNGKGLFTASKYFDFEDNQPKINAFGIKSLTEREEKGFLLYVSSQFAIPLKSSVRLTSGEFAELNMNIAQYKVTPEKLKKINELHRPADSLKQSPWIYCPWLFPTWQEVNEHLSTVTEHAKKDKGIFRAWCPVDIDPSTPFSVAINAIRTFYRSSTYVSAKFTCPLPYIDYFLGQIVCIKKNWNPTWNLLNNAKAFVVGIKCESIACQKDPLMSLDKAVSLTLKSYNDLKYSLLVKPLIPFTGPSAIEDVPGIIEVPWVKVNRRISGCKIVIHGPNIFPANAFSHHQSQGSTFERSVATINEKCKTYGMANVVTSRTPSPDKYALTKPVTLTTLQPCPGVSKLVESEYNRIYSKEMKSTK